MDSWTGHTPNTKAHWPEPVTLCLHRSVGHRGFRQVLVREFWYKGTPRRDPFPYGTAPSTYGIHTFDWVADWAARAKPAAMAANCAHPARMVLGPGGL